MPRGGHIDIAVLGGYQVSERGDLANWKVKGSNKGNIGGAMDIAVGAKKVFVAMTHFSKNGEFKIVRQLNYPVTALRCVDRIYTDMAVIDVTENGLMLMEIAPGFTVEEVQAKTEPRLLISEQLTTIAL
jgi:3-oxoacid CoA-transferase B subunit